MFILVKSFQEILHMHKNLPCGFDNIPYKNNHCTFPITLILQSSNIQA